MFYFSEYRKTPVPSGTGVYFAYFKLRYTSPRSPTNSGLMVSTMLSPATFCKTAMLAQNRSSSRPSSSRLRWLAPMLVMPLWRHSLISLIFSTLYFFYFRNKLYVNIQKNRVNSCSSVCPHGQSYFSFSRIPIRDNLKENLNCFWHHYRSALYTPFSCFRWSAHKMLFKINWVPWSFLLSDSAELLQLYSADSS